MASYSAGADMAIQGFLVPSKFDGMTVARMALEVYQQSTNILLAVQDGGLVKIFRPDHCVHTGDVAFVITDKAQQSVPQHAQLKDPGVNERLRLKASNLAEYEPTFAANRTAQALDMMKQAVFRHALEDDAAMHGETVDNDNQAMTSKMRKITRRKVFKLPWIPSAEDGSLGMSCLGRKTYVLPAPSHAEEGVDRKAMEDRMVEEKEEATKFVHQGGHILLLLCQPELLWQQVVAFIKPLRESLWNFFSDVAFLGGNPMNPLDLIEAGATNASKIVMLSGPPECNEPRLADANAIMVSATVENLLVQAGQDNFAIYEFSFAENISVLQEYPESSLKTSANDRADRATPPDHSIGNEDRIRRKMKMPLHLLPRYASGQVFVSSLLGGLYAQAYQVPGIMEIVEAVVMPSRRQQTSYPWLVRVPPTFVGRDYASFVGACITRGLDLPVDDADTYSSVIPVGLLREDTMCYVETNPPPETCLRASDRAYVFASEAWGHAYTWREHHVECCGEEVLRLNADGTPSDATPAWYLTPLRAAPDELEMQAKVEEDAALPSLDRDHSSIGCNDSVGEDAALLGHKVGLQPPRRQPRRNDKVDEQVKEAAKLVRQIFPRYVVKDDGKLSVKEEFEMLALNVFFKLDIQTDVLDMEEAMSEIQGTTVMDVDECVAWFQRFLKKHKQRARRQAAIV